MSAITKSGRHGDGGGLYLVVDKSGAKRWIFLYRRDGTLREMGLGGLKAVTLPRARELAAEARANLQAGVDPIATKKSSPVAVPTFGEAADDFIDAMEPQFRNAKHRDQWKMTLDVYAAPMRTKQVDDISTSDVLEVLKPIWLTKPETAARLRGPIERVLRGQGKRPPRGREPCSLARASR